MRDSIPSVALRELRSQIRTPRLWAVLGGIAAILAVSGPFGTGAALGLMGRALYWGAIVAATYAAGALAGQIAWMHLARLGLPRWAVLIGAGLAVGLSASVIVVGIGLALPSFGPHALGEALALAGTVTGMGLLVTVLMDLVGPHDRRDESHKVTGPPILRRLPLERRGPLRALSAEDHYVRVATEAGEELVLMRLADAIEEAAPTPGLRIHRSHWVALDAVEAVRRDGERAILTLRGGAELPASRANVPALRQAGLL